MLMASSRESTNGSRQNEAYRSYIAYVYITDASVVALVENLLGCLLSLWTLQHGVTKISLPVVAL